MAWLVLRSHVQFAGMAASSSQEWSLFTPRTLDGNRCMARTWSKGCGGQCVSRPLTGSAFCKSHDAGKFETHGRCDGPIPPKKLAEFVAALRKRSQSHVASTTECKSSSDRKRAASKEDGPGPRRVAQRTAPREQATATAQTLAAAVAEADVTPGRSCEVTAGCTGRRVRRGCGASALIARAAAASAEVASAARSVAAADVGGRSRAARKKQPFSGALLSARHQLCLSPIQPRKTPCRQPRLAAPPNHVDRTVRPCARSARLPASLSGWAKLQVLKIVKEVEALPRSEQRAAWKQHLRQFHPDKLQRASQVEDSVIGGRSEEQMIEVFLQVKLRYDAISLQEKRLAMLSKRRLG